MSLTKIGSIGVSTGIQFAGVTTVSTLHVGSGVTISPDGDGFFTGVVTATSYAGSGANLTGIDTDLVSDTTPQLGGNLDVNTKNIVFGDSSDGSSDDVLSFGASGDLKIFHQADQSRIVESGPSVLKIMGSDVRISNAGNTADYFQGNDGSDVKLFHNGNLKLATTSSGINVTGVTVDDGATHDGDVTFTTANGNNIVFDKSGNDLVFGDSVYARFGAGDDLSLGHDGSNSYISDAGTGDLVINGSVIRLKSANTLEDMLKATENGAVELYHDNNKVCETITAGIKVQRTTATSTYIELETSGGIAGYLYGESNNQIQLMDREGHGFLKGIKDGAVQLYHDNSVRAETMSSGFKVTRSVDDSSTTLKLENNSTANSTTPSVSIKVDLANGKNGGSIDFVRVSNYQSSAASDSAIVFKPAKNDTPTEVVRITEDYVRLHSNSSGIQFNSDTAAANALDDYEEGTYTPVFDTGMSGISYQVQSGNYVKIGKLVRFDFYIQVNGGVSNNTIIAFTLPMNSAAGTNSHRGSGVITYHNINDGNSGSNDYPALYIGTSSAQCYMGATQWKATSGSAQSNRYFIGGGTYHAA